MIEKLRLTVKEIRAAKRSVSNSSIWGSVDEAIADAQHAKDVRGFLDWLGNVHQQAVEAKADYASVYLDLYLSMKQELEATGIGRR